jgi:hypothetical protein
MAGEFDFGSEYIDYQLARDIEEANAPRSRRDRQREKKRRPRAPFPKWVMWSERVIVGFLLVWLAFALIWHWLGR